jgi:uncharacterized protein YcbK (DUF882 family)
MGFAIGHSLYAFLFRRQNLDLRCAARDSARWTSLFSNRRLWAGVSLAALLLLTPAAPARSPRLRGRTLRRAATVALIPAALLLPGTLPVDDLDLPEEGTKYELKLHHLHTGESIDVVYRIGDTYIPTAMAELNHFLRDHRTEDQSKYDPKEFDLLHNVLARLGKSKGVIDIVCGYRTPWSNNFLRSQGPDTGVAEHSQHVLAKAIDIRVPGVTTSRLRDAALSLDAGGVGYYPRSQFVHVDVGPVRQWSFGGGSGRHVRHRRSARA